MKDIRVSALGSLDKDTEYQLVRNGNYTDANDVRHLNLGGNIGESLTNFKGNSLEETVPALTSTVKKYRIYVDISPAYVGNVLTNDLVGTITVLNSNLVTDSGVGQAVITFTTGSGNLASQGTYMTALQTQLNTNDAFDDYNALVTPFTFSNTTNTGTYTGYFDLVATDLDDATLEIFQEGDLIDRIVLIQDSFTIADGGAIKITGAEQVGANIYVSSCSENQYNGKHIWELGCVEYDENTDVYSYTRLLRTNSLGFSPDYRVQIKGEKNGDKVYLYMTDRNTFPRAIYVNEPVVEDGALTHQGGEYSLSTIDEETRLFLKRPGSYLTMEGVLSGGNVKAGNKRYTGRFLTEALTQTEIIHPLGPINVYLGDKAIPSWVSGADSDVVTDKKVVLKLNDIPAGVYKYFELIVIEYQGSSESAKVVQRYDIKDNTELIVEHIGIGQELQELSFSEVLASLTSYDTVGSIELINNRLVTANFTEEQDPDLSDWALDITHGLQRTISYIATTNDQTIKGVGKYKSLQSGDAGYIFGEYQDPYNVLNKMGYMWNDTYRFGIQVKWKKTGKWSKAYYVDDIRIDISASNVTSPNRRDFNLAMTNFTLEDSESLNVPYVVFRNIDLSYLVDDVPLHSLIDAFRFVRAERIPEVLATGMLFPALLEGAPSPAYYVPYFDDLAAYDYTTLLGYDASDFCFFQSPDLFFGKNYTYQDGDSLKVMGNIKQSTKKNTGQIRGSSLNGGGFTDCSGFFVDQSGGAVDYTDVTITEASRMGKGKVVQISAVDVSVESDWNSNLTSGVPRTSNMQYVFKTGSKLYGNMGNAAMQADDTGGPYYAQVYRDLGGPNKYPLNKELTVYKSTGHLYTLTPSDVGVVSADQEIFGGDVFTQKSFMVLKSAYYISPAPSHGVGIAYYSQNTVNTQMRTIPEQSDEQGGAGYVYPQNVDMFGNLGGSPTYDKGTIGRGLANWLEQWPERAIQSQYNKGYDVRDDISLVSSFDPNSTYTGRRPTGIAWSSAKISGSLKDDYRIFKPLDTADLDQTHGPIEHIMELNSILYTWQRDSFQRQYFNDPTTVGAAEGTDVILGTGAILGLRGQELSAIGSDKKWSIFKGKTSSGKDVAYWYNNTYKKIMRFGADGTTVISDPLPNKPGISSYLKQYVNFISEEEEPITGFGVHGVWNHRYNEAIFTFKGFINTLQIPEVGGGFAVTAGTVYSNTNAPITHKSGLPSVFVAKSNFTYNNLGTQEPGVGSQTATYWDEKGPEDYPQYYTMFTIAFDERKNGFSSFHGYYPNIYIPFRDNFISTDPLTENEVWVHDNGAITSYYGTAYDANATVVLNIDPNLSKQFIALQANTNVVPDRIDFTTRDHTSFLTSSDFEEREDYFYSTIKNNAVAGVVTGDSSRLFGRYLLIKLNFDTAVDQRLINFIVKIREKNRLYSR